MKIEGRTVVITGASRGIGAATARVFANAGANVALLARGGDEIAAIGITPDELMQETSSRLVDAEQRCDELVAWFLENIAQRHMA